MTDKKRTFDDLLAAAVEEAQRDERAAEADQEKRLRERIAELKRALDECLDPVIADACALRYEATEVQGRTGIQAVLTADGEMWTIWPVWPHGRSSLHPENTPLDLFSFEGPKHPEQSVRTEQLQQALLIAIAQRRQQRTAADDNE